jgi:aryl-alcohol dehydrogenase-like predicted oxidoreductase
LGEDAVEYRTLGRTGLKVSALCLGTMQWGWTASEAEAVAVMDAFVEAGGTFIDTADNYSRWAPGNPGGVSEEIIGRWLHKHGNRRDLVIATKVRSPVWDSPNGSGLSRKHIMEAVDASLRRLGTDYIDLYQAHAFDPEAPIDETMRAFEDLVRQGKVLYLGASNYPAWRLAQALAVSQARGWARFDAMQPHYNLVHRGEYERELRPLCAHEGVGVIPYSPLAGGFLTGKYRRDAPLPTSARAEGIQGRYYQDRLAWETMEVLEGIARGRRATPTQVSLAWLLAQPAVVAPIIGANTVEQLRDSLGAIELVLSMEELQRLDAASGGPYNWND